MDYLFQFIIHQRYYVLLLLSSRAVGYQWLPDNKQFDCVVGITVNDVHTGIGIFISTRTIITSANPLNDYLNDTEAIIIHTVDHSFDVSRKRKVESVFGNQSFRKTAWVAVGYNDTTHTSIHDIALINLIEDDKIDYNPIKNNQFNGGNQRKPLFVNLPHSDDYFLTEHQWVLAGFGYVDMDHVQQNYILEATYFDSVLANCDEWFPREWGRFICLVDDQDLAGVASGAPLFHTGDPTMVLGIGCFGLKKDNEKILVFTNLVPYVNKLYGYIEEDV